jgi:hypothetical protein
MLTDAERADVVSAWGALASDDPTEIDRCLPGMKFVVARDALEKQRARFPSSAHGLGRTEQTALELIGAGAATLASVLAGFSARLPDYCWTDQLVASELGAVMAGPKPLVDAVSPARPAGRPADRVLAGQLSLTATGNDVLAGRDDRVNACGIDTWIGGAHLTRTRLWRFDEAAGRLVASSSP